MSLHAVFKVSCFGSRKKIAILTLLHSERPKLHGVLALLSAIGLIYHIDVIYIFFTSYKKIFLCPRDDSQGALRFAPVCPSVFFIPP